MTHALGLSKTPTALKAKSTNAKAGAALSVMDEREKRNVMNFHTLSLGANASPHLLLFASLHHQGRGISVPCDEIGNVDMDSLTLRLRNAYLGARAMVGRDYSRPTVQHLAY